MDTLQILDGSGHLTLTWDPHNQDDVAQARKTVEDLKGKGYSFFAVLNRDEVAAGRGKLLVERIDDPIEVPPDLPALPEPAPIPAQDGITDDTAAVPAESDAPRRRGRGRPSRDVVATRPLRGG